MARKSSSVQVNVRMSAAERARLQVEARRRGFRGVADYLRAVAFSGSVPREYDYTVVVRRSEREGAGYWAEVPALQGCNTRGATYQQTIENAREAIVGYLEMLIKRGQEIPIERKPKGRLIAIVKVTA